jgi:hypothetical protein
MFDDIIQKKVVDPLINTVVTGLQRKLLRFKNKEPNRKTFITVEKIASRFLDSYLGKSMRDYVVEVDEKGLKVWIEKEEKDGNTRDHHIELEIW